MSYLLLRQHLVDYYISSALGEQTVKRMICLRYIACALVLCGFASPSQTLADTKPAEPPATEIPQSTLCKPQIQEDEWHWVVSWNQTAGYGGQYAYVFGKVVKASEAGGRCHLNFSENWRKDFSASINEEFFPLFEKKPNLLFQGKTVVIRGRINCEVGKPEMVLSSPKNIWIVPDDQKPEDFIKTIAPHARNISDLPGLKSDLMDKDTIRIGTYNILNLFDEYDDPYTNDEVMSTKPRKQLEQVAAEIRKLDADVLALQEVENLDYLKKFVRAFLADMGYQNIILIEGNNHRGIDVAVLSRYPVGPVTTYRHTTFPGPDGKTYHFQRDFLKVHIFGPKDFEFDIFSLHLKSKYGGAEASEPIRQAEAGEIRRIADEMLAQNPGALFVICGDHNDYWDSPSLKIMRGEGETELTCPGLSLPEDKRITYNREPYRSMIDFIVCSPGMKARYVEASYRVLPGSEETTGSDHNPSVAAFRVGP